MELPVPDIDRSDVSCPCLEQTIGEPTGGGADVRAVAALDLDSERSERVRELLAPSRYERRRALHAELDALLELLPGLIVARHEPGKDQRLRLTPALGEALLHEKDVESLACGFQRSLPWELVAPGGEQMPTWLLVLIIVLVVLALFGGFGYTRR